MTSLDSTASRSSLPLNQPISPIRKHHDGNLPLANETHEARVTRGAAIVPNEVWAARKRKQVESLIYGGRKSVEWQQALAPAEIVTFDRLTGDMESLWWLLVEAPGKLKTIRDKTRNPFDVKDVLEPDGDDVKEFVANVKLSGDGEDPNAKQWAEEPTAGQLHSLEGEWLSRWNTNSVGKDWITGRATLKVVGDRVYVLHKDQTGTCLIDARRDGISQLVGRYMNLANRAGSTPWVGVVVDDERIDGEWAKGRWDLRRKINDQ